MKLIIKLYHKDGILNEKRIETSNTNPIGEQTLFEDPFGRVINLWDCDNAQMLNALESIGECLQFGGRIEIAQDV